MHNQLIQQPLSDEELDTLSELLDNMKPWAMNIEMLDGFFAALVCSPEVVLPGEYLPVIFGGEPAFDSEDHACTVLSLIMRHWNTISSALHRTMRQGGIYLPVLMVDEHGMVGGNDWAWGFMRGVRCRPAGWHTLMETEEMSECMLAIMVLLHEHSPDPATRPPAISADCREELLHTMMTDLTQIYRHFAPQRQQSYGLPMHCKGFALDDERACPCGSGQKYKYCCAVRTPTLH